MPGKPKGLPKTGGGSRKGIPNRATAQIKDMIEQALTEVGGVEYLKVQAIENPGPFLGLVGKILPKDIYANVSGDVTITKIVREVVHATHQDG